MDLAPITPTSGQSAEASKGQRHRPSNEETVKRLAGVFFAKGFLPAKDVELLKLVAQGSVHQFVLRQKPTDKTIIEVANRICHSFGSGTLAEDLEILKAATPTSKKATKAMSEALIALNDRRYRLLEILPQMLPGKIDLEKLQPLIDDFNALPKRHIPEGKVVLEFPEGALVIDNQSKLVFKKAVLEKVPLSQNNTITPAKVDEVKRLYDQIRKSPYNNLGPILEFMRHVAALPQGTSLQEALSTFTIDPAALYDKYRGGDCTILSAKTAHAIENAGLELKPGVVGVFTTNAWTRAPAPFLAAMFPESPQLADVDSTAYCEATDYASHCGVVIIGSERNALIIDPYGKEEEQAKGVIEQDVTSSNKLMKNALSKGAFLKPGEIIKQQMLGKYQAVVLEGDKIFGYDLVRGNVYINAKALEVLPDVPKSIDFSDIETQENMEALRRIGEHFGLPEDFVDNMVTLAKHRDEIVSKILVPGIHELKQLNERARAFAVMFASVYENVRYMTPLPKPLFDKLKAIRDDMTELTRALAAGRKVDVDAVMLDLEKRMADAQEEYYDEYTVVL